MKFLIETLKNISLFAYSSPFNAEIFSLNKLFKYSLKIFAPIALLSFMVLVPVNWMGKTLQDAKGLKYSNIDKISISNIPFASNL